MAEPTERQKHAEDAHKLLESALDRYLDVDFTNEAQTAGYLEALSRFSAGFLYAGFRGHKEAATSGLVLFTVSVGQKMDELHRKLKNEAAEREADAREG